uniref:Glycoside hydrolase family 5 n=1 Tax=Rhizophlyctis rosea TaxID=64517 RepID=A0A2U8U9Y7_9FUNG|nr:glycoside hydrolase family 5 [Rhizophlyctis rosea]
MVSVASLFVAFSAFAGAVSAVSNGVKIHPPLHTKGDLILDSNDNVVRLAGANWFGVETENFAPLGLSKRNYKDLLDQVKELEFNTIRFPWCNEAFESKTKIPDGVIDYTLNPELKGKSPLQVYDAIIEYGTKIGLMFFLDRHRVNSTGQTALWYTDEYPESRWISDWKWLAGRYAKNPYVIGADLHNEPHEPACWGCGNSTIDWSIAAKKAGDAIHKVNPNWIIIVEGIGGYWWGGNLEDAGKYPVVLQKKNKVVYSAHEYPHEVYNQTWFSDPTFPDNLPAIWDDHWGYIKQQKLAPVLVGEFGTFLRDLHDYQWLLAITDYLGRNDTGYSWTFWCLNPESGDTGGIFKSDWVTGKRVLASLVSV